MGHRLLCNTKHFMIAQIQYYFQCGCSGQHLDTVFLSATDRILWNDPTGIFLDLGGTLKDIWPSVLLLK